MIMKYNLVYLINCDYEEWCQGWDNVNGYFLVYAPSFDEACSYLENELRKPQNFRNCTINQLGSIED